MKLYNENFFRIDKYLYNKRSSVFLANKRRNHIESYYEAKSLADHLRSYVYNVFSRDGELIGYAVPR